VPPALVRCHVVVDSSSPEHRATESHNDWTITTGSPQVGRVPVREIRGRGSLGSKPGMTSRTEQLLLDGGFAVRHHADLVIDIQASVVVDSLAWTDMEEMLEQVCDGTAGGRDWEAPMSANSADIGEIKLPIDDADRMWRLYVHAPASEPGTLWLLRFAWKPRHEDDGQAIQTNHVNEAAGRLLTM
jgi:hypothetical protein